MKPPHALLFVLAATAGVLVVSGGNNTSIEPVAQATMVEVDTVPVKPNSSGVWDFSGLQLLSGRKSVTLSRAGDSAFVLGIGDSQLTYLERNDSLYWTAFENPGAEMRQDSLQQAVRPVGIPYPGPFETRIEFSGRFSGIKHLSLTGTMRSECSPQGAIALGGDTIWNVTMERELLNAEFAAKGACRSKEVTILRYSWHVAGGALPVAESTEATILSGGRTVSRNQTFYIAETLGEICDSKARRMQSLSGGSRKDGKPIIEEISANGDLVKVMPGFPPESAGERYEVIVVDLFGRVYGTAAGRVGDVPMAVEIRVGHLPSGRYLVKMTAGRSQTVKMFSVK